MTSAVLFHRFQSHPEHYLQQVRENAEPLIVVQENPDQNVVILAKKDYHSILKTIGLRSVVDKDDEDEV